MKRYGWFSVVLQALMLLVIVGAIYEFQMFRLYAWEANHLFQFDWGYCIDTLSHTGGGAMLVASLLTQFFRFPWIGVLCVLAIYVLIFLLTSNIFKKSSVSSAFSGWLWIPIGFLFLCIENDYYRFQGHVAFLMSVVGLLGYLSIRKNGLMYKSVVGVFLTALLYHLIGPAVWIMVVGAFLLRWKADKKEVLAGVSCVLALVVMGLVSVELRWVGSMEKAFLPALYYDHPATYFFPCYAWLSYLLIILAGTCLSKWANASIFRVKTLFLVGGIFALLCTLYIYRIVHSPLGYKILKEQYYAEHGCWEDIVQMSDSMTRNHFICYLHLALAQQGKLPDSLPHYRVFDESQLSTPSHVKKVRHSLLAHVYYHWRDVEAASDEALAANHATPGECNPEQLKILIQALLVQGKFEMAERFIGQLEKTLFYRAWAKAYRPLLYRPDAVKHDSLLGEMGRSIPQQRGNQYRDVLKQRMKDMLDACPSNPILEQFFVAYMMLGHGG